MRSRTRLVALATTTAAALTGALLTVTAVPAQAASAKYAADSPQR